MKKIALHWQILIGLAIGILIGYFFPDFTYYLRWMGIVFLRALKMVIVPLLLTSIMSGIINIGNPAGLGKIGLKTMGYYLTSSLLAIVTGLLVVNVVQPGVGADLGFSQEVAGLQAATANFGQTMLNIVPENIFQAFSNTDMLSIIFFSFLAGIFSTRLSEPYAKVVGIAASAGFELVMKITNFIILFTPLGVLAIIAGVVSDNMGEAGALAGVVKRMGLYMVSVLSALFIHAFIILPLLLRYLGKVNPIRHGRALSTPLITAFSTSSSSATLPLTLEALQSRAGVSNKISSFVLPLGATVNMDGTALYECVAAMFIAQAYGVELSFLQQMLVVFTALLASIGAAGIPMAGLVMITVILSAVGLPLEGVGLIIAVDRILDMFRTAVNVWSDSCGTAIIATSEGEHLKTGLKMAIHKSEA